MLDALLEPALADRRENSLYRTRRVLQSPQSPAAIYDGQTLLSFCSNDYLGLANHPTIRRACKKAIDHYGVGSGASHLLGGHSRAHQALEEAVAELTQRDRALVFSTGYMANIGVMTALFGEGDPVFSDKLNHASLVDGARFSGARVYRYLHANIDSLTRCLARAEKSTGKKCIVTDGVFSVDGDIAPLRALADKAQAAGAFLMVDDAHGIGVLGEQGQGSVIASGLSAREVPILMGTFGKALGCSGAFVAGSHTLIEHLIQFARSYVFTTAMPPAVAEAARVSLCVMREESWRRQRLTELIAYFKAGAEQLALPLMPSNTPIQPLLIGDAHLAVKKYEALSKRGILVGLIRPPTVPARSARLRVTLTANHTTEQMDQLLEALNAVFRST